MSATQGVTQTMKLSAYLAVSRHGIYYFRWPLPKSLFGYNATLRISLKTKCSNQAGDLARYLASCGRVIRGDRTLAKLRKDEIRKLVKGYFQASLDRYVKRLERDGFRKNALEDMRHEMELHEDFLGFETTNPQYLQIEDFKRQNDFSDQDWADNERVLVHEMRKARRGLLERVLNAAEKLDRYFADHAPPRSRNPSEAKYGSLGDAIRIYMDEHSREWKEKVILSSQSQLDLMLEFFGQEIPIAEIGRKEAAELKQVLLELPVNRNTKPELRGLTLREAIALPNMRKVSTKTLNIYIDTYRRFFVWAEQNGYAPQALFTGMKVSMPKNQKDRREPFIKEELLKIYQQLVDQNSPHIRKDAHRWGALIGLYTGARLNEVAQLQVADVKKEDDIWYFNMNDEGEKQKLKNKASKRKIPVHSKLIELGLLRFIGKQNPTGRLFSEFSYNKKDGYGRNLGRWFNGSFLVKLRIKQSTKSFHSLRHTMITQLSQSSVEEALIKQVVGHERAGITQSVYNAEGYTLRQIKDVIERFEVVDS